MAAGKMSSVAVQSDSRFRELVLALPEVEERETWGHPTFRLRNKMFATLATDADTGTVKASREEQTACVQSDPETFFVPAYVGTHGWIGIQLAKIDPEELAELITEAWRLTAPKRLLKTFDDTPGPGEG
jgi:hypothetical protein